MIPALSLHSRAELNFHYISRYATLVVENDLIVVHNRESTQISVCNMDSLETEFTTKLQLPKVDYTPHINSVHMQRIPKSNDFILLLHLRKFEMFSVRHFDTFIRPCRLSQRNGKAHIVFEEFKHIYSGDTYELRLFLTSGISGHNEYIMTKKTERSFSFRRISFADPSQFPVKDNDSWSRLPLEPHCAVRNKIVNFSEQVQIFDLDSNEVECVELPEKTWSISSRCASFSNRFIIALSSTDKYSVAELMIFDIELMEYHTMVIDEIWHSHMSISDSGRIVMVRAEGRIMTFRELWLEVPQLRELAARCCAQNNAKNKWRDVLKYGGGHL